MANQSPFPLMPPRSTELRLQHLDEYAYKADSTTLMYKLIDALCGTSGVGALINEIFLARMGAALETIYFNELDYIFGNISFLSRCPTESYNYNPLVDQLTSDQWDEVRVKDAWYRARIKNFFQACGLGGTPEGIRMCVFAAIGVDCDIFEVWRYEDNFGLGVGLGRSVVSARNEVVIRPHKDSLSPIENRLLREMLNRLTPVDTVVTVSLGGLSVSTPLPISGATADSEYFEVQKILTGTPLLQELPAPELLTIDLLPTEQWMFSEDPTLAPYAAFNISQEYGYYYLVGGGKRSPIDSVIYGTLQSDGSLKKEPNYELYETTATYTNWTSYEKADCKENFPGGKWGLHPDYEPALHPDGTPYVFPYETQLEYIDKKIDEIISMGGIADRQRYRMPIQKASTVKVVFWPDYAVAYSPPAKDSTVSKSLTRRRPLVASGERRDPAIFVRS